MRIILFFGLSLISPFAVTAQSASSSDVARVEQCVQNNANRSEAAVLDTCLGVVMEGLSTETTLEISEAIQREHAAWDRLLNVWWAPMKARAQAEGSWNRLLASQRQWIKDRDRKCQEAYDSAGGGSIRVIYGGICLRDMTAEKAVSFYYSLYN